jgi:hypothetical protein
MGGSENGSERAVPMDMLGAVEGADIVPGEASDEVAELAEESTIGAAVAAAVESAYQEGRKSLRPSDPTAAGLPAGASLKAPRVASIPGTGSIFPTMRPSSAPRSSGESDASVRIVPSLSPEVEVQGEFEVSEDVGKLINDISILENEVVALHGQILSAKKRGQDTAALEADLKLKLRDLRLLNDEFSGRMALELDPTKLS